MIYCYTVVSYYLLGPTPNTEQIHVTVLIPSISILNRKLETTDIQRPADTLARLIEATLAEIFANAVTYIVIVM